MSAILNAAVTVAVLVAATVALCLGHISSQEWLAVLAAAGVHVANAAGTKGPGAS